MTAVARNDPETTTRRFLDDQVMAMKVGSMLLARRGRS
jgi:hypothetical protein